MTEQICILFLYINSIFRFCACTQCKAQVTERSSESVLILVCVVYVMEVGM